MKTLSVFDNLIEGVQVITEDLRYFYLNKSVKAQAGLNDRDVLGMKCEDVFPGIEQSNAIVQAKKCLETGQPISILNKFEFPDGKSGYFELRYNRIPQGVLIFSVDQTEFYQKEEQLRIAYERYETITAATNSAMFEWNTSEKIVFGNSLFQDLCQKFKGKSCETIDEVISIGNPNQSADFRKELSAAIAQKNKTFHAVLEQFSPEEGIIAFQLHVVISYDKNNEPAGFIGYILDATDDARQSRIRDVNERFDELFLSDFSLEMCLEKVVELMLKEINIFRAGECWLPNYDHSKIRRRAYYSKLGKKKEPLFKKINPNLEFDKNEGLPGKCLASKKLIWWDHLEQNDSFVRKEFIKGNNLSTGIALPISINNEIVAIITLFSEENVKKYKTLISEIHSITDNLAQRIMNKRIVHQRNLLNDSKAIVLLHTTVDGKFIRMNPTAEKLFLPTQYAKGNFDIFCLIDPDHLNQFEKKWKKMISSNVGSFETSVKMMTSSGKSGTLKINVTKCPDDDSIFVLGLDITKEIELQELLSLFNDLASIGFLSIDLVNWETIVSGNIREILGIPKNEVLNTMRGEFLSRLLPEDIYSDVIEKLFQSSDTVDVSWEHAKGAETKTLRFLGRSEFKGGLCIRISGIVQDLTEVYSTQRALRKAEANYLELFDQNPIPMWLLDPESFRFNMVNDKATELYGYSKDEFKTLTLHSLNNPSDINPCISSLQEHLISSTRPYIGNFRHIKKNGESLLMDVYAMNMEIKGERTVLLMAVDRTEHIGLENEMSKAVMKAEETQLQSISQELHDNICQLLAASNMYMFLLKMKNESKDPEYAEYLEKAIELNTRANEETRSLSHSLSSVKFQDVDLHQGILMVLEGMNIEDKLRFNVQFTPELLDQKIKNDLKLNVIRIVQESITNTLKHSKAKSVKIKGAISNNQLQLSITDDGLGFDMASAKKGIGLHNISKRIEVFGGKLELISFPGNGTTVKFDVPLNVDVFAPVE